MNRPLEFDVRAADVPRRLFSDGRCRFSLGTSDPEMAAKRRAVFEQLRIDHEWEILHGVSSGHLAVLEVVRRVKRSGQGAYAELRRDMESTKLGAVPTFDQARARYMEWYRTNRAPQSVRNQESRLKRVGEQPAGPDGALVDALPITEISGPTLERAFARISERPGTVYNLQMAVSGMYSHLIGVEAEEARTSGRAPRWDMNPIQTLERPERDPRVETASEAQVRALLAAAELYQMAYVRVLTQVGIRRDELIHTRLHLDLNVETWLWRVQPRGPDDRCGCVQCRAKGWSPKTRRGRRVFRVLETAPELREAIEAYLEAYPAREGDFVFRNPRTGGVWERSALRHDFRSLCRKAGVRYGRKVPGGITIHTLRHTCATELVRKKVPESVIAGLLGDTLDTIARTYVHLNEDDLGRGISEGPRYA